VPDPPEPDAEAIAELHLREQVMDRLSEAYAFPIASILIEREFEALWKAAQEQVAAGEVDRGELRLAAERRVRLGVVVAEIARRHGISERTGSELEDRVIAWITAQARVTERLVPAAELREMD
jgi:FKBP-type peptidyl-prolyl cis-trans isomerase (trigger factor)